MNWEAAKTSAPTRLLVWVLAVSLLLLPGATFQKRFHCRITGATNLSCCCQDRAGGCAEDSPCSTRSCCSEESDEAEPNRSDSSDGCGCCDVTYEQNKLALGKVESLARPESKRDGGSSVALHPAPTRVSFAPSRIACWRSARELCRACTGPPVYLLHCTFLI